MKNLWIKLKNAFLAPKITPLVVVLQIAVLIHASFLFQKVQRHFLEDALFMAYVVGSAYYWKRYARRKKEYYEDLSEKSKSNHSH